jgi:hypothetical protein
MTSTLPKLTEEIPEAGSVIEIGVAGTKHTGGYLVEEEKDSSLVGSEKYRTFSNLLLNTSVVAASVRYYLNLVTKAGWRFTPAEDDKDSFYADLVNEIMNDMMTPFHRVVRRAAMFRFYGYSIHEWTAKQREDGNYGFFDIAVRPQRTIEKWEIDDKGRMVGAYQTDPNTGVETYIPRWKLLYVVDDSLNDNPEGVGLFRHLVYPARRLERYEQLEGYGFESDLRGVPIGRAPLAEMNRKLENGDIDQATYDRYLAPVMRFLKAHVKSPRLGMLLDSATYSAKDDAATPSPNLQWNIELLRGSPTSLMENAAAIERINLEMARMMGTEHLLIGGDGKGSMALSTDKSHNFALIVESSLKEIAESVQKDILPVLWVLNGWPIEMMPITEPEPIRFRNPEQITSAILDMARAGAVITPEDPVVNAIRDVLNLPRTTPETLPDDQVLGGGKPMLDENGDPILDENGQPVLEQGGSFGEEDGQPDSDTIEGAVANINEDLEDK